MPICVAVGCNNYRANHKFPKDPELRRQWIENLRRPKWQPTKNSRLCIHHFTPDSFFINSNIAESIGFSETKKFLKKDAVPTIFAHNEKLFQAVQSSEREGKHEEIIKKTLSEYSKIMNMSPTKEAGNELLVTLEEPSSSVFPLNSYAAFKQTGKLQSSIKPTKPIKRVDIDQLNWEWSQMTKKDSQAGSMAKETQSTSSMIDKTCQVQLKKRNINSSREECHSNTLVVDIKDEGTQCEDIIEYEDDDDDSGTDQEFEVIDEKLEEVIDDDDEYFPALKYRKLDNGKYISLPDDEAHYTVSESALMKLLKTCTLCGTERRIIVKKRSGTRVKFAMACKENHFFEWETE